MIEGVRAPGWTNSIQQKNPQPAVRRRGAGQPVTHALQHDAQAVRRPSGPPGASPTPSTAMRSPGAMAPISRRTSASTRPASRPASRRTTCRRSFATPSIPPSQGAPRGGRLPKRLHDRRLYEPARGLQVGHADRAGTVAQGRRQHESAGDRPHAFHANNRKDMNTLAAELLGLSAGTRAACSPSNLAEGARRLKPTVPAARNYSHYGVVMPGIDDCSTQARKSSPISRSASRLSRAPSAGAADLPLIPISTNGYLIVARPARSNLGFEVKSRLRLLAPRQGAHLIA